MTKAQLKTVSHDRLVDIVDSFLQEQHVALYGRAFGLLDTRERTACTSFLVSVIEKVQDRL